MPLSSAIAARISSSRLTATHERHLARSYRGCLDTAVELGGESSVALGAISTAVFGFPAASAAGTATRAVFEWLERHPDLRHGNLPAREGWLAS